MTFGREKRLLLGWLALLAPLPLPFNQVLEWPALFVYVLLVLYFIQRADRDPESWLPDWALNLLGIVYVPFLLFELRLAFRAAQPFTALLHLIMFLLVVKLYSIRREKDKWHLMVAIFFLFIGSMATSSHVTITIFLVAFLTLAVFVLSALTYFHVLAAFGKIRVADPESYPDPDGAQAAEQKNEKLGTLPVPRPAGNLPVRRPLLASILLIVLVAVPLFASMPRIREPFILGRGGAIGMGRTTGFSDSVNLSLTSTVRSNRSVALRIQYDIPVDNPGDLRFKGATYDRYENRNWYRNLQHGDELRSSPEDGFRLSSGEVTGRAIVFQEPLQSTSLIVPVEAVSVEYDRLRSIGRDLGGALILPGLPRRDTQRFEVSLASAPQIRAKLDPDAASPLSALDTHGVTERMQELAVTLMGGGTASERIDRLEQTLLTRYDYTLDFVGRDGLHPLEDFLFVYRSGHCEYFASAMVLLLRSQGIPARLATGFLGAEYNPLEDYYIVRQQNAHAWVEAYSEDRGWRVYDPTPPDGRPAVAEPSFRLLLSQMWDYVTFRWDRYVLTYGAADQESLFQEIREQLARWWSRLKSMVDKEPDSGSVPSFNEVPGSPGSLEGPDLRRPGIVAAILASLLLASGLGWWLWHRRKPRSGADAYRRLRWTLDRAGLAIGDNVPPLELERLARERFPEVARDLRVLVSLYLSESFAERDLTAAERECLASAWSAIRKTVRAERQSGRPSSVVVPAAS